MEFTSYLGNVFEFNNFIFLVLGTAGGLILGATPGLSPTMAVALLIPFTFVMPPETGLILLGATYTGTVAGGAISAILLKIPGAPANIATIMDGHPMAQKGRSVEALHYCFFSSCIGGIIGMMVLVFFTPVLASWALGFGFSHLFWIAIFGVTIIGAMSSGSISMGLISGCIGLWLSVIGVDSMVGVERFVISEHLYGGIHIIPALVGLFAIPQAMVMLEKPLNIDSKTHYQLNYVSLWSSFKYNISRVKSWLIGSITGIIVGLVPGAGGQIAGLVAYDQARKTSKDPNSFGKGNPDGIIAAESANNAMVGPSLAPLLTLSIPGSPTAAVLLGGLLIHGIFPGPDLFINYPKVTWTFINSMIVGQILMLFLGLLLSRFSHKVMVIPQNYMAAAIFVLAVFGSYSVQNNFSDIIIMFALGLGMYFLSKVGFSSAPLVLGLILGPIAENNFQQGKIIAETQDGIVAYFTSGPLNLFLIFLCFFSVIYGYYSEKKAKKALNESSS